MSINFTISLADRYAAAKAAFDAAEAELKAIKAEVIDSGMERHVGITCDITLSLSEQRRVDNTMLQAFLTEDQIESCRKAILVHTIRVKAKGIK